MRRSIVLVFILVLTASSLIMVRLTWAQTKPFVPEFTTKFVDNSYDVPTTSSIDPYTGQNVTHQGYHVNKVTLVMTIQNQPLVYQYNGSFFYNIRVKGHYAENWTQLFLNDELPLANASFIQTSVTLETLDESGFTIGSGSTEKVPFGGQEDFQVHAMIGGFYKMGIPLSGWVFQGESSGWSNTQTITIPETPSSTPSPSPSLTPSSSPTQQPTLEPTQSAIPTVAPISAINPLLLTLGIVALATAFTAIAISLILVMYFRKIKK
jgi:hypothetical protein